MERPIKVLLVEDSEDDAALLIRTLQCGGYELVYEAVETPEAMADALDRQEWDLVISDYSMPRFSGLDALKLLQEKDPDLSFILMTGQVGEEVAVEALKAGAHDYIMKSNPARLIPAVERELRDTRARRENRRTEQALLESQERYRLIVETANEGIWQIDEENRTTFVNQEMAEIFGYTVDEMMGQTPYTFMDEEWSKIAEDKMRRRRQRIRGQSEYKFQRKDGTDLWALVSNSPIFLDDGSYAGSLGMLNDITEHKRSEAELALRVQFLDRANDSIVLHDFEGRFHYVNEVACRFYGYAREELMQKSVFDLNTPASAKGQRLRINELRTKGCCVFEAVSSRKDGARIPVEINASVIDIGGKQFVLSVARDITERKQTEEALKQSEEKYRSLVENLNDVIYTVDAEGHVSYISPAIERFTGYKDMEVISKPVLSFVHPEDQQGLLEAFRRSLSGQVEPADFRILRKDGTYMHVRSFSRVLAENGQVSLTGALSDITGHKLAEEELRSAHQELAQIIEFLPDATFVIDGDRKVIAWNRAVEEMTGVNKESIIGRGDYAYAVPFYGERRPVMIDFVLDEESSTALKYEYIEKASTTIYGEAYVPCTYQGRGAWLWGTASPLVDDEGKIVGAIESIRDITERKRTEEELEKHRAHLEEMVAERTTDLIAVNQELEAFTHSVSHDLRAPLRRIQGFSQVLLEDYAGRLLDKQGSEHLERLKASSQHMSQLIDDLLDLSRVTSAALNRQQTDLSAMAQAIAADLIREQPERQAHFDIQEGITVSGDPDLLYILLQNLLDNAWKFAGKKTATEISFGITIYEGRQAYCVRDNGAGFDMAHAGKLFEPFQRLHTTKEYYGTGIGLASVKRIIRRHGGQIWAESEVDRGATFYFTLK